MSQICDNCGADLSWDPDADAMVCAYCDHQEQVARGDAVILERPLTGAEEPATGLGIEMRAVRCENCGATVTFGETATADHCVYCGSPSVLDQEMNRHAIRPESLIPLDVGRETVERNLKRWRNGLWFRPNALKRAGKFAAVGVYVPFWTFDCEVYSNWRAESGTYYWVTETYTTTENGRTVTKTRRVRKTRWRPASGSREDSYDDILICASRGLSEKLVKKLGHFDTRELVPYKPDYLAGWSAEEYEIDLAGGWGGAARVVESTQYARCGRDVPGDTYRSLSVENHIEQVYWKHVLLPVWSCGYEFRGKSYRVLVHGQSGLVVGEAPLSWVKILLLVLFIVAIGVGIFFLASQR